MLSVSYTIEIRDPKYLESCAGKDAQILAEEFKKLLSDRLPESAEIDCSTIKQGGHELAHK